MQAPRPEGLLTNKVALIAGASGALGRGAAMVLAAEGAKLALAARHTDALTRLADELAARASPSLVLGLDVCSASSVKNCVSAVFGTLGPVDILVNAFGVTVHRPALEQTEADWDKCIDTNLKGVFLSCTEVARWLCSAKHGGSIINFASILGFRQAGFVTPYAVSKAGVAQLTQQSGIPPFGVGRKANSPDSAKACRPR
jgi:3-oxoacyl-[acyl-carrier protein] reductase